MEVNSDENHLSLKGWLKLKDEEDPDDSLKNIIGTLKNCVYAHLKDYEPTSIVKTKGLLHLGNDAYFKCDIYTQIKVPPEFDENIIISSFLERYSKLDFYLK